MPGDIKVSVNKFIQASAKYVDDSVKKANGAGPGAKTLSQAEAKKLPKDLRDNFLSFRNKKHPEGSVPVKDFVASFKSYVAATAKKADADHDGYLKGSESKNLPADLRDNFLNFYRATEAHGAGDVRGTPVTTTQKLEYVYTNECDNQSVLKASVKLPGSNKKIDVELRNPKWKNWDALEQGGGKTFKVEGHVILNKDLRDMSALSQGTAGEQAESNKAWDDLYKDTTHFLDTNSTAGIFVVDKMTLQ